MTDDQASEETPGDEDQAPPAPEQRCGVPVTRGADGMAELHPSIEQYLDTVAALREEEHHMLLDLTAVDYLTHPGRDLPVGVAPERFEVVLTTICHTDPERVRVRVQVPEATPTLPSLFDHHPGSEALEREVFDMFGITFDGHPDLTRILMPEDWDGHPLRKDYAVGAIPVQFKADPSAR